LIEDDITEIFTRLNLQAGLCGRRLPSLPPESLPIPLGHDGALTPFSTLIHARHSLNTIIVSALPFINSALALKLMADTEKHKTLTATRQIILTHLALWKVRMDLSPYSPSNASTTTDITTNILLISHINATIWTRIAIYPEESAWDTQLPSFKEIITLSYSVINSSSETIRKGPYSLVGLPRASPKRPVWRDTFTFEMGVIPPLYFTAVKCRDTTVRHEAIRLLGLARPRKEGLWDARALSRIAERVVEIEENGMLEPALVPEKNRVHDALWLDEYVEDARSQKVSFLVRLEDPERQWEFREEILKVW